MPGQPGGKDPRSPGRIFGEIVAGRLEGLVHIETSSGTVYCWNRGGDSVLAEEIARLTGYALVRAESDETRRDGGVREIRGCLPGGEAVFVNGIVIGTATAETVVLASENGALRALRARSETARVRETPPGRSSTETGEPGA
ncbi:DUF2117 domain-containing protein, partial [Methanoculleus chikugoensis]|uniref:DUF2117 domain-containing protein n=1 Tax=Methanoculleus chikugoensis TaxID=118126 RepID=UPI001FB1B4A4